MKTRSLIPILVIAVIMTAGQAIGAERPKGLMENLGLPIYPGAKLVTEGTLTAGQLLDDMLSEYGPRLGLHDVERVSNARYSLEAQVDSRKVFDFYEPAISEHGWKKNFEDLENKNITAVYFNEGMGLLYLDIDPPGAGDREFTFMRVFGKIDPSKAVHQQKASEGTASASPPSAQLAGVGNTVDQETNVQYQSEARIPVSQPISLPPSQRLHVKFATSDIRAKILDRNTAEISLQQKSDDPGELQRLGERLVLAVTPKAGVDEVLLPSNVPLLIELTDGSLTLTTGPNPADRPLKLSIISTGAPVTLQSFPLVSGVHRIKSLGGEVDVILSVAEGGALDVEVTGKALTVVLPRSASATLDAFASSGKIDNLTGIQPEESSDNHMKFRMGAGKAEITLRAINGTVCIKLAE
jgi:hypothetical protein